MIAMGIDSNFRPPNAKSTGGVDSACFSVAYAGQGIPRSCQGRLLRSGILLPNTAALQLVHFVGGNPWRTSAPSALMPHPA